MPPLPLSDPSLGLLPTGHGCRPFRSPEVLLVCVALCCLVATVWVEGAGNILFQHHRLGRPAPSATSSTSSIQPPVPMRVGQPLVVLHSEAAPHWLQPLPRGVPALPLPHSAAGWVGWNTVAVAVAVALGAFLARVRPTPRWAMAGVLLTQVVRDDDPFSLSRPGVPLEESERNAEGEDAEEDTPESYAAKRRQVQARARDVIRVCDPLWKLGYLNHCEYHYQRLYKKLLTEEEVTMDPKVYNALSTAFNSLDPETGHRNCFLLREGLEKVIRMPLDDGEWQRDPWQPQPFDCLNSDAPVVQIFDFSKDVPNSYTHTDQSRFGDSLGHLVHVPDKQCVMFEGVLGSAMGAPFVSAWLHLPKLDVSGYSGFYIDCCVPKQYESTIFQFAAVPEEWQFRRVSTMSPFLAHSRTFSRVLIPKVYFQKPTRFGKPAKVPLMNWSEVVEIGFIILRPSIGPFRLHVREIGVYK